MQRASKAFVSVCIKTDHKTEVYQKPGFLFTAQKTHIPWMVGTREGVCGSREHRIAAKAELATARGISKDLEVTQGLPRGLGKDAVLKAAATLQSPFPA